MIKAFKDERFLLFIDEISIKLDKIYYIFAKDIHTKYIDGYITSGNLSDQDIKLLRSLFPKDIIAWENFKNLDEVLKCSSNNILSLYPTESIKTLPNFQKKYIPTISYLKNESIETQLRSNIENKVANFFTDTFPDEIHLLILN